MPVVAVAKLVSDPFAPGARASHSIGSAVGTGDWGLVVLKVLARLPRVGLAWPP